MIALIFLITLGLVSGAPKTITLNEAWRMIPRAENATQCMYISMLSKFTCRSEHDLIDCDAISHLEGVTNDIFGLGRMSHVPLKGGDELVKYWMYPRVFNTSTYLNHTLLADKKDKLPINVCLYQGEKFVDFGIRVEDPMCYKRLTTILDAIKEEHIAELDSDLNVKPRVSLISEILMLKKSINERTFAIEGLGFLTSGFGLGFGGLGFLG